MGPEELVARAALGQDFPGDSSGLGPHAAVAQALSYEGTYILVCGAVG